MELTQILPVSIPKESLLVSGLKDIQEHGAEDRKTYKNNSEHSACMQACYCYSGGKKMCYCHCDFCSAAVHVSYYYKDFGSETANNK